ncbi:MAG TPA: cytochrome c [Chitinophagales bacterium]|nr:cytochrome c [Chitinophagales bacterium]HRP38127.1 cytochrome c [Chitinophagales bacterium]
MNRKTIIACLLALPLFFVACNSGGETATQETTTTDAPKEEAADANYDPSRGEGEFDSTNVVLGALDPALATKGKAIADTKCASCHKMTSEQLVGPGWKGVTERRTPHWILNFITNPDPMIEKDPAVQAQLEACLVRMPNQNLNATEAREILEYMRQNDGAQ